MQDENLRIGDAEREQAIAVLRQAAEDGRLTVSEYTTRLDVVLTARTWADLQAVIRDIAPASTPLLAPAPAAAPAVGLARLESATAILSGTNRTGPLLVGNKVEVVSILGECKLDLRDAEFTANEVLINATVVMGSLEIMVPPGVPVQFDETLILAENKESRTQRDAPPRYPVICIAGINLMGSIHVKDGETGLGKWFRSLTGGDNQR